MILVFIHKLPPEVAWLPNKEENLELSGDRVFPMQQHMASIPWGERDTCFEHCPQPRVLGWFSEMVTSSDLDHATGWTQGTHLQS